MHADKAVRTIRERGEGGDGDRRSVAGEDHAGPHDAVGILEHGALDFEFFGDGFNDEIGGGDGGDGRDGLEAGKDRGAVGFSDFALFDFAVEVFANRVEGAVEEALVNVPQDDREAGAGEDVGDAVAHGAGAEDGDGFDGFDGQGGGLRSSGS